MDRTIDILIEPHQIKCGTHNISGDPKKGHIFAVHYPGILERCVACKVYKYKWTLYTQGVKTLITNSNDMTQYE